MTVAVASKLKQVGKDRIPSLQEYLEDRLDIAVKHMENGTSETFEHNKGRIKELRNILREIDFIMEKK